MTEITRMPTRPSGRQPSLPSRPSTPSPPPALPLAPLTPSPSPGPRISTLPRPLVFIYLPTIVGQVYLNSYDRS